MLPRQFFRFISLALLISGMCLFFCGCAYLFPAAPSPSPTPAPSTPRPTLSPSPTPRAGNPVWLFYQDFYDAAQQPLDALHASLTQAASAPEEQAAMLEGELLLCALEDRLTEGMMSFGLLLSADSNSTSSSRGSFSSSVSGAATGSGSIAYRGSIAELSFQYEDGASSSGSLSDYRLRYTYENAASETYSILLLHAPQGWVAQLTTQEGAYILRCAGSEIGLYVMPVRSATEEASPAPSAVLNYENCILGYTHCWLLDGSTLSME